MPDRLAANGWQQALSPVGRATSQALHSAPPSQVPHAVSHTNFVFDEFAPGVLPGTSTVPAAAPKAAAAPTPAASAKLAKKTATSTTTTTRASVKQGIEKATGFGDTIVKVGETPEAKLEGPARQEFIADLQAKRRFFGGAAYEQSRTAEQQASFRRALHGTMDLWYSHRDITKYLLTALPAGTPADVRTYDDRGWCFFERSSAQLCTPTKAGGACWPMVVDVSAGLDGGAATQAPPLLPAEFDAQVQQRKFTNGADMEVVSAMVEASKNGA